MTLSLARARDLIDTLLGDTALQVLIDAVNADIARLGGTAYPMRFSGTLLDVAVVSADGASTATQRSFIGSAPPIGNPLITMTETALVEVSYTLQALDSGAVTVTIDGDTTDDSETLSDLADRDLEELSFYVVATDGRIELQFDDAAAADSAMPQRVRWQVATAGQEAARNLLKGIAENERVRFVIARPFAGLRMPAAEWERALERIAVSCLRIAVTDEGVARYMERGGDAMQTLDYLQYSAEYRDRMRQVLDLTGDYFA